MYPNRVALSNDKGHTSIVNIARARAKAIGTLQEDFSIGGGYIPDHTPYSRNNQSSFCR
jgi:hypothetical protein